MKEKNGEHPFGDAGQLILLCLFLTIWALDSYLLHITTFVSDKVPLYIRITATSLFILASIILLFSSHSIIHHVKNSNGIVSTGPFKYVRHPLYLSCLFFYLGLVVLTLSLVSAGFFIIIFIFYNFIAGYEEKLLKNKYGDIYKEYMKRTHRWFPRMG